MAEIMVEKSQLDNKGTFSSISKARNLAKGYANRFEQEEIESLEIAYTRFANMVEKNNIKLDNTTLRYLKHLEEIRKSTQDMIDKNEINYKEASKLADDYEKELQKVIDRTLLYNDTLDETAQNQLRNYSRMASSVRKLLDEDAEIFKESTKSMTEALGNSFKNLKDNIRDLSLVSATANIEKGLGLNKTYNAYNAMRTNFGMSRSEYSNFTRGLTAQNFSQGLGLASKYSFDDAVEYMSKLSELGINNEKQARDMFNTVTLGTKYLGMSTETQAKILDISRRSGNLDLLNKANQTQIQIMNAQLGISKEHLNATLSQSANMADLATMFSGNTEALQNFQKEASAITSVYGEQAATSAQNIAQDILANTYNSKYLGVMGSEFNNILGMLQRGDSGALEAIIQASKNSSLSGTAASNPFARTAIEEAGIGYDNNTMTLYNAVAKDNKTVSGELGKINNANSDTNKFLKDIKTGLSEKLGNIASWIQGFIPLQNLQTIYYTMAIAEMGLGLAKGIKGIFSSIGSFFKDGKVALDLFKEGNSIGDIFNLLKGNLPQNTENIGLLTKNSKMMSLDVSNLGKLAVNATGVTLIAAGVMKGISDAKEATKKADEWGVSKTSAGIGGFLGGSSDDVMTRIFGKVLQYGAIGAGIGTLIAPGVGTAIGAVIGGLVGILMGGIGGKSIAKGVDGFGSFIGSLFGKSEGGPVGQISSNSPLPTNNRNGRGGSTEDALKSMIHSPWYSITSMFGNRPNPFGGNGSENHGGMDIAAPRGTPIGSAVNGIVDYTFGGGTGDNDRSGGGFGNHVVVKGDNGIYYVYGHMNTAPLVKAGQKVKAGQAIGVVGSTGRSTGPHLHFQTGSTRYGGKFDPSPYLTNGVLYPGSGNVSGATSSQLAEQNLEMRDSTQLLEKIISQDTKGNRGGPSESNQGIIDSVDNGFQALMNKLEELSGRQDQQEEVMKALVSGSSSRLYKI